MAEQTQNAQTNEATPTETSKSTAERLASAAAKLDAADAKADAENPVESPPAPKKAEPTQDEKLRAEHLAALAKRDRKLKDRVSEVDKREAALADREKKIAADEEYWRAFTSDPVNALKSRGIEKGYAEIANILLAHELGDAAPKELRSQMEQVRRARELEARLQRIEAENQTYREREEQARRDAEAKAAHEAAAAEVSGAVEKLDDVPHLSRLMAKDKDRAVGLIADIGRELAAQGEEPENITVEAAAAIAEARLKEHASTWADLYAPPKTQPRNAEENKPAVSSLSNRATATPTKARPANRPLQERMQRAKEMLERADREG